MANKSENDDVRGTQTKSGGQLRVVSVLLAFSICGAAIGCGEPGPELIPVSGKVTIDGKPAAEGSVMFISTVNPMTKLIGSIESDGTYSVITQRKPGAPAGEYRVTVFVTETPKDSNGNYNGLPRTLSDKKFSNPNLTPLKVEVKAEAPAGAYDLAVTS
ncbi:MAG TPA: hypothetical protein VF175_04485 [Lacipirellula sp.]